MGRQTLVCPPPSGLNWTWESSINGPTDRTRHQGKEISQRTEQMGKPWNLGHLATGGDLVLEVMSPIVEHLVYDKSAAL